MNTDKVFEWFTQLTLKEQEAILLELDQLVDRPVIEPLKVKHGHKVIKLSSKDCSLPQRSCFLACTGSGLHRLKEPLKVGEVSYDQVGYTDNQAWVFSQSEYISCRTKEAPEDYLVSLLDKLTDLKFTCNLSSARSGLDKLNKSLAMRVRNKFDRLPVSNEGELLFIAPYYPNNQASAYYLPAYPWQRVLYTLGIGWYTRAAIITHETRPHIILADDFHLAVLPLNDYENFW